MISGSPSFENDLNVVKFQDWTWQNTGSPDKKIIPWGMRRILMYIKGVIFIFFELKKIVSSFHLFYRF